MYPSPNAHIDIGISTKKRVVITREMCDRTSSQAGLSTSPGAAHSEERKLYPRSARTQAASIAIYL